MLSILFFLFISSCRPAIAGQLQMEIDVVPQFGFISSTGVVETLDISHAGTNTKYSITFRVYSQMDRRWGIEVDAPAMMSGDGKDRIDSNLVNYKLYGGQSIAVPPQSGNTWLPLPSKPTVIYMADDSEVNSNGIPFILTVYVTPKTSQMLKVYKTRVRIGIVKI